MLCRWARQRAVELNARWFKGSPHWLYDFKKRNKISSRKITKFRSPSELAKIDETARKIEEFRNEFAEIRHSSSRRQILNIDQSGFNREGTRLRTLSHVGERDTEVAVDSINNIKHSYTILPILTRDGRLIGPVTITLQETQGRFGPIVTESVSSIKNSMQNIVAFATGSGIMTTAN